MTLHVWLGETPVGTLRVDANDWIQLDLDDSYWERDPRPVIGLALEQDRGKAVTRSRLTLPPILSNLLPEGELRRLVAEHHGIDPRREFALLARLGEDLAGALCFVEGEVPAGSPAPLAEVSEHDAWAFSSLAGVQPKFTVERDGKGFALAAKGRGERWIVKVPDGRFERVPETELAVTQWARVAGLTTVDAELVEREAIRGLPAWASAQETLCFASRRYDRAASSRVHQEDFCQVFNVYASKRSSAASYDRIAKTVLSDCGPDDAREIVRRLAFMIVSGNTDLHLKNWSLYYPDGVRPRLAPAYDLISTLPFIAKRTVALRLARENELDALSLEHFRALSRDLGPLRDEVVDIAVATVKRAMSNWRSEVRGQMAPDYAAAIDALHARSSLVAEVER